MTIIHHTIGDKLRSLGFGILVLAAVAGIAALLLWIESERASSRDACIEAKMEEMREEVGAAAEQFRDQADQECRDAPP